MAIPRRKSSAYVYRSIRVFPDFWTEIESIAGREQVSVNSLINALLDVVLAIGQSTDGREVIHQACNEWRVRREVKETARRRATATQTSEEA